MSQHLTTSFAASVMRQHGYLVLEGPAADITGGAADSRGVRSGDLFTAFPGENVDGNRYVADALHNGAVATICEQVPDGDFPGKTIIVAPDATRAVGELANAWRVECNPRVVGITGTVGKTTAKDLAAAAVADAFSTHKSAGNFNSREGLPLALLSLRRDHEVSVLEMAMDSIGEILYLCEIADPEVGVVMNVGLTHVEKLGSVEAIQREKLTLARYLSPTGTAVLNVDDPRIAPVAHELRCNVIAFGSSEASRLRCRNLVSRGLLGVSFDVGFDDQRAQVNSPVPGAHTVPAAMAAIGVCLAMGMDLKQASDAVSGSGQAGRSRIFTGHAGATVIDDRYNSSPDSLAGALRMLGALPGRRIALLGRMAELGEFETEQHAIAGSLAAECADILVVTGDTCRDMATAATAAGLADVRWFATKEQAASNVRATMADGDTVLVKASRGEAFETILPLLEGNR